MQVSKFFRKASPTVIYNCSLTAISKNCLLSPRKTAKKSPIIGPVSHQPKTFIPWQYLAGSYSPLY